MHLQPTLFPHIMILSNFPVTNWVKQNWTAQTLQTSDQCICWFRLWRIWPRSPVPLTCSSCCWIVGCMWNLQRLSTWRTATGSGLYSPCQRSTYLKVTSHCPHSNVRGSHPAATTSMSILLMFPSLKMFGWICVKCWSTHLLAKCK